MSNLPTSHRPPLSAAVNNYPCRRNLPPPYALPGAIHAPTSLLAVQNDSRIATTSHTRCRPWLPAPPRHTMRSTRHGSLRGIAKRLDACHWPRPRSTPGAGPIAPTPYSRSRGEESCCWRTRRRAPPKDATTRCCHVRSRRHCRWSVKEDTKLSRRSSPLVVRYRRLLSRGDEETDGGANCRHIFSSVRVVWYVASRIFSFSCVARHPRTRVCRGWNLLPLGNQNPPRCMLPFYNPLTYMYAAGYC